MASVDRFRKYAPIFGMCVVICVIAVTGCNSGQPRATEGNVIPKGRILKNGLPLKPTGGTGGLLPPGDAGLQVIFIKIGTIDAGTEIAATIKDESGTFELIGNEGKGIPPGKYRVAVYLGPAGSADELKGKYSRENSKIEVEVKKGEDLIIDLANTTAQRTV